MISMSLFCSWKRLSRSAITSPSLASEYQVIRSVVVSAATGPPNRMAAKTDSAKDVITSVVARMVVSPLRSPAPHPGPREVARVRSRTDPSANVSSILALNTFGKRLPCCQSQFELFRSVWRNSTADASDDYDNTAESDPRGADAGTRLTCHGRGPRRRFGFDSVANRQWRDAPRLPGHDRAGARCDRGGRLPAKSSGTGAPARPKPACGDDRGQSRQSSDGDHRKLHRDGAARSRLRDDPVRHARPPRASG